MPPNPNPRPCIGKSIGKSIASKSIGGKSIGKSTSQRHMQREPPTYALPPDYEDDDDMERKKMKKKSVAKRSWKPGTVALREIKKYQKSTELLIKKAPFARLVRHICEESTNVSDFPNGVRISQAVLTCLQEACESYAVALCEDTNLETIHRKRIKLSYEADDPNNSDSDHMVVDLNCWRFFKAFLLCVLICLLFYLLQAQLAHDQCLIQDVSYYNISLPFNHSDSL
jgi:histone H3/H4